MRSIRKTLLAGAVSALLGAMGSASASTVDLFTQPVGDSQVVQVGRDVDVPFSEFNNDDGSIIGGFRDLVVSAVGTTPTRSSLLAVADGRLTFSNDTGVTGLGIVQWDGGDNSANLDPTGLGGLSLINQVGCPLGGCTFFETAVFFADQGFAIELGVYTAADEFSLLRFTTDAVDNPMGVLSAFQFSWFNTPGLNQQVEPGFFVDVIQGAGGGADFNDVGALQLRLNTAGTVAVDLDIGAVTKDGNLVPEPSALALAGIALLGAAAAGRRRKATKS